jgi:hypothetical protein
MGDFAYSVALQKEREGEWESRISRVIWILEVIDLADD